MKRIKKQGKKPSPVSLKMLFHNPKKCLQPLQTLLTFAALQSESLQVIPSKD
ncbi:MAG: hypothetical protein ACJAZ9_000470 [Neolewinella sp.]|jgi:hypothetical protein